jgi:hypothetical protein
LLPATLPLTMDHAKENAMQTRPYIAISTLIFIAVTFAHACRLYRHWPLQIGTMAIPMEASWVGLVIAGALSIWGIALLRR